MDVVILAAGRGVRLGEHSQDMPKSLVDIAGTPYLAYQFLELQRVAKAKRFIVGGFGIEHLQAFLTTQGAHGFELLNNTEFFKGNLFSLKTAASHLQNDFVLFNADHYYSRATYEKIFAHQSDKITIFCDHDRGLTDDDMKVLAHPIANGFQLRAMAKTLQEYNYGYVGVTFVPKAQQQAYWRCFAEVEAKLGDKANVEHVLDELARQGHDIRVADISGSWWTEIDTPQDLDRARKVIANALAQES